MDLQLDVRIQRIDNKIVYVVGVYDIDSPVNYHSYDCYYFKQGSDLNEIMTDLKNNTDFGDEVLRSFADRIVKILLKD
jgi:hypothetical protein